MIATSNAFKECIKRSSRTFRARFIKNGVPIDCEIKKVVVRKGACEDNFSPGTVFAPYISAEISNISASIENEELLLQIGLLLDDGTVEYTNQGYFTVSKPKRSARQISFDAVGRISSKLNALPDLPAEMTLGNLANAITAKTGVTIRTNGVALAGTITAPLNGFTCREILEVITSVLGGFATEDGNGNIVICKHSTASILSYNGDYTISAPSFNDYNYTLSGIKVVSASEYMDDKGNTVPETAYTEGVPVVTLSNSYMTEELFPAFSRNVIGFSFKPGEIHLALGDPRIEPWDCISFTDIDGSTHIVPCLSLTHTYDGGLTSQISAKGSSETESALVVKGPIQRQIERLSADLFTAKDAILNRIKAEEADLKYATIEKLDATEAYIKDLEAKSITTENLYAKVADLGYATVERLKATDAKIDLLDAKTIKAEELEAKVSGFGYLKAGELSAAVAKLGYATVTNLNVVDAKFGTLSSTYATLDLANVKEGSITSAMIGTGVVGTAQIADGSITDAKIVGLTASKITAGTLDAGIIDVINLNAANINVGTINGQQIAPGAIDLSKLSSGLNQTITNADSNAQNALNVAVNAQATADGKNTAFYQASAPSTSGRKVNDLWFDTNDGNKMYYWNGSAWTASTFGNSAIANLDAGKITTGYLNANRIEAGSIKTSHIDSGAITADKIAASQIGTRHLASDIVTATTILGTQITGDQIASKTITANNINVEDLFAKDITASGKIIGVELKGARGSFTGTVTATEGKIGPFNFTDEYGLYAILVGDGVQDFIMRRDAFRVVTYPLNNPSNYSQRVAEFSMKSTGHVQIDTVERINFFTDVFDLYSHDRQSPLLTVNKDGAGTCIYTNLIVDGNAQVSGNLMVNGLNVSLANHTHSNYSSTGHTHDDRYYTESEINNKLVGYLPLVGGNLTGPLVIENGKDFHLRAASGVDSGDIVFVSSSGGEVARLWCANNKLLWRHSSDNLTAREVLHSGNFKDNIIKTYTWAQKITVPGTGAYNFTMGAAQTYSGYTFLGYLNKDGGYTDQWLISYGTYGSNVVAMVYSKFGSSLTKEISCTGVWIRNAYTG